MEIYRNSSLIVLQLLPLSSWDRKLFLPLDLLRNIKTVRQVKQMWWNMAISVMRDVKTCFRGNFYLSII